MPDASNEPDQDTLASRVDSLETGQASISERLDRLLGLVTSDRTPAHQAAEHVTEERLSASTSVADEVRRELARARAKDKADADKKSQAEEVATLRDQVKSLTERPPREPVRTVTRIMYGQDA